ncbi:MAG: flagellar motor protein MotB [Bdellovibrionales bacterium]
MAEKEPIIVIKKITVVAGGGHGGSWKVAFADFMTALMAFFLLMWLLGQSDQTKKAVSDYFSTPSIIEYNFSNYGVELTLEKLFLDLVNEPLKFLQSFVTPMDYTPNFMQMGSKNIVMAEMADQLGDFASEMNVTSDEIVIEIPERNLFVPGTAEPGAKFVDAMEKLAGITAGLEDANVFVDSRVYANTVKGGDQDLARKISEKRLDLVVGKAQHSLEHESVDVFGKSEGVKATRGKDGKPQEGFIRIRIKQKDTLSDGSKPRKLGEMFGGKDDGANVYNNFVKQISDRKPQPIKK